MSLIEEDSSAILFNTLRVSSVKSLLPIALSSAESDIEIKASLFLNVLICNNVLCSA